MNEHSDLLVPPFWRRRTSQNKTSGAIKLLFILISIESHTINILLTSYVWSLQHREMSDLSLGIDYSLSLRFPCNVTSLLVNKWYMLQPVLLH